MDKESEEKYKKGMRDAIYVINKLSKKDMTLGDVLLVRLKRRAIYVENKLESCKGYSPKEKEARLDEIKNLVEIIEKMEA